MLNSLCQLVLTGPFRPKQGSDRPTHLWPGERLSRIQTLLAADT